MPAIRSPAQLLEDTSVKLAPGSWVSPVPPETGWPRGPEKSWEAPYGKAELAPLFTHD
jgi:hypothetical protein